jgi:hypothetical protein
MKPLLALLLLTISYCRADTYHFYVIEAKGSYRDIKTDDLRSLIATADNDELAISTFIEVKTDNNQTSTFNTLKSITYLDQQKTAGELEMSKTEVGLKLEIVEKTRDAVSVNFINRQIIRWRPAPPDLPAPIIKTTELDIPQYTIPGNSIVMLGGKSENNISTLYLLERKTP